MCNGKCRACGIEFEIKLGSLAILCPNCKSEQIQVTMKLTEELPILHDRLDLKVKDSRYSGKHKLRKHIISGSEIRRDDNKWMEKNRLIDKDQDLYMEKVTDSQTGEIVHECNEPLSKHWNHGSAKKKNKP